jgi:SAM-dependent methyltransferase
MTAATETLASSRETARGLARCLDCHIALGGKENCPVCGRSYPEDDGILAAIGPLEGTNRIAASFYDGPAWPRFRRWEQVFLWFQKGVRGARMQVLRHLPRLERACVLEVGIGDGENLRFLPPRWTVFGVDIARTRLAACRARFPTMSNRLVWAEGEDLPFPDCCFDAVYSVGGFNYFRDQTTALREMRRVTRPGSPVIVADEIPDLYQLSPARVLGLDELDQWALCRMGLDPEFVAMVLTHRVDIDFVARNVLPGHRRYTIWSRLGYCLVDSDPAAMVKELGA